MNVKERAAKRSKMQKRLDEIRAEQWPDEPVWDKNYAGFTTIPKTMPYIMRIIDAHCDGKPAGRTYFALWCRAWDAPVLHIDDPRIMAYESGFDNERAESTWKGRMKKLEELGFIKTKAGVKGDYQYVLLVNPHRVIKENTKLKIPEKFQMAFDERFSEIGAKDFKGEETKKQTGKAQKLPAEETAAL